MPVSSFSIRELSGERRSIVLTDRALPYRPFELTTRQRVELTWYPGNPIATATILGSAEEPSTIQGTWKDKYIARNIAPDGKQQINVYPITVNDIQVDSVQEAKALFDDIVRQGQLLEVTWFSEIRQGYLTEFKKRWLNVHDLEWELQFSWISRGEPVAPTVIARDSAIKNATDLMKEQNIKLQNDAVFNFPIGSAKQDMILDALIAIDLATEASVSVSSELAKTTLSPHSAAQRAVAVCNTIQSSAQDLTIGLSAEPLFALDDAVSIGRLPYGQRLRAYAYSITLMQDARALRRTASIQRAYLLSQLNNQILGVYTARAGDDLRSVSKMYYGTPFEWRRLMQFNQLRVPELDPGTVVLIPSVTTGGAGV